MTQRHHRTAFALAAAALAGALAAACASTPEPSDDRALAGCYYFVQDATARELNLPWGVELSGDSLTTPPTRPGDPVSRVAVTLRDETRTTSFPFGYWQAIPGDSVRIGYPGMGGFDLRLAVRDAALEGTAIPVGDAGFGPRDPHAVRLDRARCPGE